ncbi:hypothetical protein [Halosolutus gelatinilyticus]|uniref:hypothetical protein n=1 Tax=Halosolutus gelatinilyticus TaxID=2931975 RepID=UPI001FF5063C|nr:hypothetical protein [Halosolutus gelatinilyticus]
MTGEHDHDVEYHLREALRHLGEAQENGELRKTNDVAIDQVSNTIASVLNEHNQDGS